LLVLVGSMVICILFAVRVHPHPNSTLKRLQSDLALVERSVIEEERDQARRIHSGIFDRFEGCVAGFGASVDIAGAMALASIIGLVLELRRRRRSSNQAVAATPASQSDS